MFQYQRAKDCLIRLQNVAHMNAILGTITQYSTNRGVIDWWNDLYPGHINLRRGYDVFTVTYRFQIHRIPTGDRPVSLSRRSTVNHAIHAIGYRMEFKPCEICYSGHITFDEVYDVFTAT